MANIAGTVEYVVKLSTDQLKSGVTTAKAEISKLEKATGETSNAMSTLKIAGKLAGAGIVAGMGMAVKATGDLIGETIGAYKEYEQLEGGVKKIFGEDAMKTVVENAQNAFRTAQISANDYMEQVTSFSASLMQSTGNNAQESAKIADMAIRDMADNANTYGTSMEAIQNAYQGFAKQNYTMLDNLKLGYGGTKTEMERLLADAEKLTGIHYDISNLADVYNAIHAIQEESGVAGTSAKEAMTTISGSANMVKSAFENIKSALGSGDDNMLTTALDGMLEGIEALITNVTKILPNIVKGVSKVISSLASKLPSMIQDLLPSLIEGIVTVLEALVQATPQLLEALLGMTPMIVDAVIRIAMSIVQVLPQLLVILAQIVVEIAKALVNPENLAMILNAGVQLLVELVKAIPQIIIALVDALPTIIESIVAYLTDPKSLGMMIEASVDLFLGLVQAVPKILTALVSAFGKLFGDLWDAIKNKFTDFVGQFSETIRATFVRAINKVLEFIENFINSPINVLNGFIDKINEVFGSVGVNLSRVGNIHLGRMATGGIVPATAGGQLILAGEGGEDEWVVPESKMADMIAKLGGAGATGGNITINVEGIYATSESQKREVAIDIWNKIQEVDRSRMGAMNLGGKL